uniref:Rieske-like [2Fe-2S] domain-containing protein n=1 Tax=Vitis vinifera TaxID=29760 RepID=A5BKA0_VITVI|nr:hypothetical protein VITISV_027126 [Vitis vinifera]
MESDRAFGGAIGVETPVGEYAESEVVLGWRRSKLKKDREDRELEGEEKRAVVDLDQFVTKDIIPINEKEAVLPLTREFPNFYNKEDLALVQQSAVNGNLHRSVVGFLITHSATLEALKRWRMRRITCKATEVSVAEESSAAGDGENWVPVVPLSALPKGERRVIIQDGETILLLWYKDQVYAIENRSPAEGAYSEGLLNAKLTQEFAYKCIPQISNLTSLPVEVLLLLLLLVMVVLVNLEEKSCVLMWVSREKTLASLIGRVPEWVDG